MHEFYHKFYSRYLERDFELLVFGDSGTPLILFPTSRGRYYDNKDNGMIESISGFINDGKVKVYCPDGIDAESWYNENISPDEKVERYLRYEKTILREVIEFAKYETEREKVALAGCSMGAYYAANIAFKHQNLIDALFTMSGMFDIKEFLNGYYDEDCYFNNPFDYLANTTDPWKYNHIKIFIGTGQRDFSLDESKGLSWILNTKGVPHLLDVWADADHHWFWWKQMLLKYLAIYNSGS